MLFLSVSQSVVNKVAFYSPTDLGYSEGDVVEIEFNQDLSNTDTYITSSVSSSKPNYLIFDIPSSELPQAGGLYSVSLVGDAIWNEIEFEFEEIEFTWGEMYKVAFDTERAILFEKIEDTHFTSSVETAPTQSYTSSIEVKDDIVYHVSSNEEATYIVYNG